MTASSSLVSSIEVPAKKLLKDDSITFKATQDGRVVIDSVKKGLPKTLQAGLVVTAIKAAAPKGKQAAAAASDTEEDEQAMSEVDVANAQRKAAGKAGGTATLIVEGCVATGKKPKKDAKLGVSLKEEDGLIVISKIAESSVFKRSKLAPGQIVTRLAGKPCPKTASEAVALLKAAKKGPITIVAIDPASAVAPVAEEEEEPVEEDEERAAPADAPEESNKAEDAPADAPVVEDVESDEDDEEPQPAPEPEPKQDEDDRNEETERMEDVDLKPSFSAGAASVERSDDEFERARAASNHMEEQHQDNEPAPSTGWLCCAY